MKASRQWAIGRRVRTPRGRRSPCSASIGTRLLHRGRKSLGSPSGPGWFENNQGEIVVAATGSHGGKRNNASRPRGQERVMFGPSEWQREHCSINLISPAWISAGLASFAGGFGMDSSLRAGGFGMSPPSSLKFDASNRRATLPC
jgi:hypothetical protein